MVGAGIGEIVTNTDTKPIQGVSADTRIGLSLLTSTNIVHSSVVNTSQYFLQFTCPPVSIVTINSPVLQRDPTVPACQVTRRQHWRWWDCQSQTDELYSGPTQNHNIITCYIISPCNKLWTWCKTSTVCLRSQSAVYNRSLRSFEIRFEFESAVQFDSVRKGLDDSKIFNRIGRACNFAHCKLSQTTQTINGT